MRAARLALSGPSSSDATRASSFLGRDDGSGYTIAVGDHEDVDAIDTASPEVLKDVDDAEG